jgi:hypothetical protein
MKEIILMLNDLRKSRLKVKKFLSYSVLLLIFLYGSTKDTKAQNCDCVSPSFGETTHFGLSDTLLIKEKKLYKQIKGKVFINVDVEGDIIEGALVEIFEYSKSSVTHVGELRIAACKTDDSGSFCFSNLPKGKYVIVISLDEGWTTTYIIVNVDPYDSRSTAQEMKIRLPLGR